MRANSNNEQDKATELMLKVEEASIRGGREEQLYVANSRYVVEKAKEKGMGELFSTGNHASAAEGKDKHPTTLSLLENTGSTLVTIAKLKPHQLTATDIHLCPYKSLPEARSMDYCKS